MGTNFNGMNTPFLFNDPAINISNKEVIRENNGITFVTGAAGNGKTTTLAALVNEINRTRSVHIITLEDPVEFLYEHDKAAISQRELGHDFFTFSEGLRSALRQAPKVVLVAFPYKNGLKDGSIRPKVATMCGSRFTTRAVRERR